MIDELPDGPDPAIDPPGQFSQKAAASVLAQKRAFQQFNAEVATLNALFAGGAYSFMYTFDSTASNADPGPGRLRMNSGTQSSANNIYIDPLTASGANIDGLFAAIGENQSVLKGALRIVKTSDPSRWALYDINTVVASSGYRSLGVTWRGGSSASPFVNNDPVMVFLDRAGDIGQGSEVLIGSADITQPTALINFLTAFSALYDNYRVDLAGVTVSANSVIYTRLAVAGVVDNAARYSTPVASGATTSGASALQWVTGEVSSNPRTGAIEIGNANGAATPQTFRFAGAILSGTDYKYTDTGALYNGTQAVSGFQLSLNSGNFTGGSIRVYGRRK